MIGRRLRYVAVDRRTECIMSWLIKCSGHLTNRVTKAANIVGLLNAHRDAQDWFRCGCCGGRGYIEKCFKLQEEGEYWNPYLLGAVRLSDNPENTYQPFAFLVNEDSPSQAPDAVWFSYYKDLRPHGGRLKLGYGPGGPPVVALDQLAKLIP